VVTEAFWPDNAWSSVNGRANLGVTKWSRERAGTLGSTARVIQEGRANALQEAASAVEVIRRRIVNEGKGS
jgi:hypothetical protein